MACPTVSRWASVRLPWPRRFRKPPYDPGRWDFPSPVLTLAFLRGPAPMRGEAQALTCIHPAHAGLPANSSSLRAQRDLGSVSERRTGTAKCPEPLCCMAVLPPRRSCPASPRRTLLPLHRSYGLMRQTCCPPCGFGIASHTGSLQVAVSPCWAQALPVVVSANPSLRVWTPTPAAPRVHMPVTSPRTLAFPGETSGRRDAISPTATSVEGNITELQSFTNVQTHKFARHAGSSHRAPCGAWQPWLLHPRLSGLVTSPCSGYAFRPNPGN